MLLANATMASLLSHCTTSSTSTLTATVSTVAKEAPGQLFSLSTDDTQQQCQGSSSHHLHRDATGESSSLAASSTAIVAAATAGEAVTAPSALINSSKFTTPKRPAGLAAVTPNTLHGTTSSSSSDEIMEDGIVVENDSSISLGGREEEERNEAVTVAIVPESSCSGGANHDQQSVVVGVGETMEEEGHMMNHNHQHQATSTSSQDGEDADTITTINSSPIVVVATAKPSVKLGPRMTPAPSPPNTAVKRESSTSSSSSSSSNSDSPVKPRNLDGALNTRENTCNGSSSSSSTNNGGTNPSTDPAALLVKPQDECPSTPGDGGMIQLQHQNQKNNTLFPSPTSFLAAKISPLRSSSARKSEEKKQQQQQKKKVSGTCGEGLTEGEGTVAVATTLVDTSSLAAATTVPNREKTPPPSDVVIDDPVNLSPGMFLCTPKPLGNHGQERAGGGGGGGSLSLSSRPSSLVPGLTPTNFASDFGKGHTKEDSLNAMDASNVFAWLHSPTGQGLFSPNGGLNSLSATNTPRSMYGFSGPTAAGNKIGITPRLAPSASIPPPSSSAAASSGNNHGYYVELEAGFEAGVNTPKIPESQRNMICISPLSSKKMGKNNAGTLGADDGGAPDTPMSINFSEVFASPRLPTPRLSRMRPPAGGGLASAPGMGSGVVSSSDVRQSSPVASALHAAERGINLDDDLNALLHLAETTTPGGRSTMAFMSPLLTTSLQRVTAAPPSSLQMPIISGSSISSSGKAGGVNISPPQLAIRSSSSCGMLERSGSPTKTSSLNKKVKKRKSPDAKTVSGSYHGQQQPTPVGYSHPSMVPYQHLHVAPPLSAVNDIAAANQRCYHRPTYISQGYVYSSTGHPAPQQHYAYPDNHLSTDHSPVKSSQKTTPSVQSKQKSKPKNQPNMKKEVKKVLSLQPPPSAAITGKRIRKASPKSCGSSSAGVAKKVKNNCSDSDDNDRITAAIIAVNKVYGDGSEKERKLKEVALRGVTQRPSRKWQAQLYYAGKSRYIGVFDSKEKASLAYEIAREVLKTDKDDAGPSNAEETERDVNLARKAAFTGVNELSGK